MKSTAIIDRCVLYILPYKLGKRSNYGANTLKQSFVEYYLHNYYTVLFFLRLFVYLKSNSEINIVVLNTCVWPHMLVFAVPVLLIASFLQHAVMLSIHSVMYPMGTHWQYIHYMFVSLLIPQKKELLHMFQQCAPTGPPITTCKGVVKAAA